MPRLLMLSCLFFLGCSNSGREEKWIDLFNGKDLQGWDTWLDKPNSRYTLPEAYARDSSGNFMEPLGLNRDPLTVFSVRDVDGSAALRISGQVWGALTTSEEFENFHLSLEYKWGDARWPPRDSAKRDSGILYYGVGEHGAASGAWLKSQECQVQEGDTGDYWSVGGAIVDVHAEKVPFEGEQVLRYKPEAPIHTIGKTFDGIHWNRLRCLKSATHEKPKGEWNQVDVYAYGDKAIHVVNGQTVMVIENSRHIEDGKEVPLTRGKIQLQSEGAEIFYRSVRLRKIKSISN